MAVDEVAVHVNNYACNSDGRRGVAAEGAVIQREVNM